MSLRGKSIKFQSPVEGSALVQKWQKGMGCAYIECIILIIRRLTSIPNDRDDFQK